MGQTSPKIKENRLKDRYLSYRRHYLNKQNNDLNEATTRLMVNHLLSDVLGYKEIIDFKAETPTIGGSADYLIQVEKKKLFVVEVKSYSSQLSKKHLRQAMSYAVLVGVRWIILTNGHTLELHKVKYGRPIRLDKVMQINLVRKNQSEIDKLNHLSRHRVKRNSLGGLIKSQSC